MSPFSLVCVSLTSYYLPITQFWDDVPLHLETATHSFGVSLPTLLPWMIHPHNVSGDWDHHHLPLPKEELASREG